MKFNNYLAFDNALQASEYYINRYKGSFSNRIKLPSDMTSDVESSTYSAVLSVFGVEFQVSDRVDNTGDFSDSVNFVVQFTSLEEEKFKECVLMAESDDQKDLLFSNLDENGEYKMYRFKDKYGIIWCILQML